VPARRLGEVPVNGYFVALIFDGKAVRAAPEGFLVDDVPFTHRNVRDAVGVGRVHLAEPEGEGGSGEDERLSLRHAQVAICQHLDVDVERLPVIRFCLRIARLGRQQQEYNEEKG